MTASTTIGARLLRAIRVLGYKKRTAFAAAVGIPYRTLQDQIAGKCEPGAESLVKLYNARVNVVWLLTGEGSALRDDRGMADMPQIDCPVPDWGAGRGREGGLPPPATGSEHRPDARIRAL